MRILQDADQQQLTRVVTLVRDVLGSDAIAAYLFGSAVLGGLRSESDLDVLAVSRRRTTHEEKQRIVDRLLAISGKPIPRGQWRRVELTIVVEREVKPWHYPPNFDFQYGDWLRSEFEIGNVEPWRTTVNPDLATLITMVVLANTSLFGPPPAQMFDPVPPEDLINAMVDGIDSLLGDLQSDTRNVLLTFARIWSTLATGVIRSKDAAADWALHRLPEKHRLVLARARAIYLDQHPEHWDDIGDQLEPHVEYVIAEIRRLASDTVLLARAESPLDLGLPVRRVAG
jgi:streptomycin 3"-adenylyltransferase